MSKSGIKERNKAIRKAWEKEQQLVQEGKGTRDWTKEQQKDILDPDKGKAYDDKGRAFEGQHMKSAADYPADQGNPDNIQFLTRDEHLEAHKGSWQNPTNWYYDPMTKEFHDFGEGEVVPCKIIELSDPVVGPKITESKKDIEKEQTEKNVNTDKGTRESDRSTDKAPSKKNVNLSSLVKNATGKQTTHSGSGGVKRFFGKVGRFIDDHPAEIIEGVLAIGSCIAVLASGSKQQNRGDLSGSGMVHHTVSISNASNVAETLSDAFEKIDRASPIEHPVSGYDRIQNGKKVHVNPYTRGGKK